MRLLNILRFISCWPIKVALSNRLTMRTTAECASSALKRFPQETLEGVLPARGTRETNCPRRNERTARRTGTLFVVVPEIPIAHAIRLGDNQFRTQFEIVPVQWIVSRPGYVAITLGGTVCRYCLPRFPCWSYGITLGAKQSVLCA